MWFWDANNSIPAKRPELVLVNKRKELDILSTYSVNVKESEELDEYLDLAWELKKKEHGGDSNTNHHWSVQHNPKRLLKETGEIGTPRKNWNCPDRKTSEIG